METQQKTQKEMTEIARQIVGLMIGCSLPEVEEILGKVRTIADTGSQVVRTDIPKFERDDYLVV